MKSQTVAGGQRDLVGVARSSGVSFVGAISNAVLGFALTVVVSRGLGAAGAGVFSLTVAVFMTLSVAGRLGVDSALVRTLPRLATLGREHETRDAVRSALLGVGVTMALVAGTLWWAADQVAAWLGATNAEQTQSLRLVAVLLPLATCGYVALAATRGLGSIVPLVVVENIVKPAARCLAVGIALAAGCGLFGVSLAWASATVLGAGLAAIALARTWMPAATPDQTGWRTRTGTELWAFALPRSGAQICEIVGLHAGIVLAGMVAGPADAGIYNAVLRVALAGTLAMQALRLAVAPKLSRLLTAGEHDRAQTLHQACTSWVVLVSWPLYLLMAIWPEHVLQLFGDDFTAGAPALSLLAVVMLVNTGTGNVGTVLLMSGRSAANLLIAIVSIGIQIGGALALAPWCGVFGVVLAKAASVIVENTAMTGLVRRTENIRTIGRPVRLAGILATVCFAVPAALVRMVGLSPVSHGGLLTAAIIAILGTIAYAAVVFRQREPLQCSALLSMLPKQKEHQ